MSDLKGKQGVYVHVFETPGGDIKTYTGQASDLGKRPKTSLNEVISKKGAAGDTYKGTELYVFKKPVSSNELDALENKVLTSKGGHHSDSTYNTRGAKNSGHH